MTKYLAGTLLLGAGLTGCMQGAVKKPSEIPSGTATGTLVVNLMSTASDQLPSSVQEVWMRMEDVRVRHATEGWISIMDQRQDVNLLDLGTSGMEIAKGDIYTGAYDMLRLVVADAWVVEDGKEKKLMIDQGLGLPQEGIDFAQSFTVDKGTTTTLDLDWDLNSQLTQVKGEWRLGTGATLVVEGAQPGGPARP